MEREGGKKKIKLCLINGPIWKGVEKTQRKCRWMGKEQKWKGWGRDVLWSRDGGNGGKMSDRVVYDGFSGRAARWWGGETNQVGEREEEEGEEGALGTLSRAGQRGELRHDTLPVESIQKMYKQTKQFLWYIYYRSNTRCWAVCVFAV